MDKDKVIDKLTTIFDLELSGVIRYTHYSLMIFGPNRLPLIDFFKKQASESLLHANLAGEHITGLGGHPPLNINNIKETFKHDITEILSETLEHEKRAIKHYYELLDLVDGKSIYLEEYSRQMIGEEEFGSIWRTIIVLEDAPKLCAARVKSLSRRANVSARTSRATVFQLTIEIIITIRYKLISSDSAMLLGTPTFSRSTAARTIRSGNSGSAIKASLKRIKKRSSQPP